MKVRTIPKLLVAVATVMCITGCGDQSIQNKVAQYNDSVQKTSLVLTNFYGSLNEFARQSYISDLRFHPDKKMYTRERRNNVVTGYGQAGSSVSEKSYPTGIPYRFSPDGIRVRLSVVQALADYSKGLAALASSDAPEKMQAQVESLGDSIVKAGQDWSALTKSSSDADDIAQFGGPLTKFAALIEKSWVSHKRTQFVKESIKSTNVMSNQLFDLLEGDVRSLNAGLYGNETNAMVDNYITEYNRSYVGKTVHSESERLQYLKEIDEIVSMQTSTQNSNPALLIHDMRKLHDELYQIVQGDKGAKEKLLADSSTFVNDAQTGYKRSTQNTEPR